MGYGVKADIGVYPATGAAAISLTTTITGRFKLLSASVHFDILPTTAGDLTLVLDSARGEEYDVTLFRVDPSAGAGTGDVFFKGGDGYEFASGDQLILAYANADLRTYGARIVVELP